MGINTPTNTALPAGPVIQLFDYGDLYQLKNADGEYQFGPGKQNRHKNEFSYDSIGNFTRKSQLHKIIQPSSAKLLPKETNYLWTTNTPEHTPMPLPTPAVVTGSCRRLVR